MTRADLADFGNEEMPHRLLRGGLPPFFLAGDPPERDFQEWMDAYWAKDILELFRLERRASFQRFLELLMAQSGGIFEATRFARPCEVSRPTIANYLAVLEGTLVAHVVRPYSQSRTQEIVAAPRVYAFDTGFVCHHRGWFTLRRDDMGSLWEHFVLNEMQARLRSHRISYWRTRHGNEIDFVVTQRGGAPVAIECKWSAASFDPASLKAFRSRYPMGENYVVAADTRRMSRRRYGDVSVAIVGIDGLINALGTSPRTRRTPPRPAGRRG